MRSGDSPHGPLVAPPADGNPHRDNPLFKAAQQVLSARSTDKEIIMRRLSRKECLRQGLVAGLGAWGALTSGGTLSAHAATIAAARSARSLRTVANIPQTLNNCGPASIAEVLAFWGIYRT